MTKPIVSDDVELLEKLRRDLRSTAHLLQEHEVRMLVYFYYSMQDQRIRAANQLRKLSEHGEPHAVFGWVNDNTQRLEGWVKTSLDVYSANHEVGKWLRGIIGIGPVLAAGLLAHIDIRKSPTAGHIWSFAGLNPGKEWKKGQKRPFNAALKTLCWKIGESFVKVSGNENSFYGRMYKERKALEIEQNEKLAYAEQAKTILATKNIGKDTDAYKAYIQGKLPPAHIHARAKRYTVKLFLSHLHEVMYQRILGQEPPIPYAISILGHAHRYPVPES